MPDPSPQPSDQDLVRVLTITRHTTLLETVIRVLEARGYTVIPPAPADPS